ncbi:hypothetical protein Gotur_002662 [Gossypium turneri]
MLCWLPVWSTCTMLEPITWICDLNKHSQMVVAKDVM